MPCPINTDVARAAEILKNGGVVAFPTETVYGLGANAFDNRAVARVFDVKGRPHFDPLIVHVADASDLKRLVTEFPEQARRLADRYWPGPLTLVLPKTDAVPDLVTAGLSTVAVRIPDHPLALRLLRAAEFPIAAPSANPFGQLSPTCAAHVAEQLGDRIDYILDGGPCRVGIESTVIRFINDRCRLLRPGGISLEAIESVIGPVDIAVDDERAEMQAPASPGMLPKHYAPSTPLSIVNELQPCPAGQRLGLLVFDAIDDDLAQSFSAVEVLSNNHDLTEAAANFFAALRRLDAQLLDGIFAVPFPEEGLGRALNDRLQRAAHAD